MEKILKEDENKKDNSIYLKIIITGESKNSVDKIAFYLDITNDVDQIISKRYPMDLDKEKAKRDLKDFYIFLIKELKLSYFLKNKKNVKHICLELEGELYTENINIHKFKRNVILEWGEVVKIGYIFFRLNNNDVKNAISSDFLTNNSNKKKDVIKTNNQQDNIFNKTEQLSYQKYIQENKYIKNTFDNNKIIKKQKAKVISGDW